MPLRSAISSVPQRWIVCALCSWAFAIVTYKNTCFYEIAEVVYTIKNKIKKPTGGCPFLFNGNPWESRTLPFYLPDVYWNPFIIEIADSAFMFGKLLAVIPAGVLSDLGYSKFVLLGGMFLVAAKHLLFPVSSNLGVIVYAVENVFEGIGDASIIPSVFNLISRWTPPSERNTLTAVVVAGFFYGDILGHIFFRLIYMGLSSWRVGQYLTGTVSLVWLVLCYVFVYHSPDESPFISAREYQNLSHSRRRSFKLNIVRLQWIPWCSIVTSRTFLSLVLVYCSLDWGVLFNIFKSLESYQTAILHLPYTLSVGSSAASIGILPALLLGGFLADWILKHNLCSKTVLKRTFAFISIFGSSALLVIACCFVGCNIVLFWVLTTTAVYTLGLGVAVVYSAAIDLSPHHAGLLTGIMTAVRTIFTIFDQGLNDLLITDFYNPDEWKVMCLVCAVIAVAMMVPFIFFGSAEKQSWARHSNYATPRAEDRPPHELEPPGESNPQ